jgi:hypothetical protein
MYRSTKQGEELTNTIADMAKRKIPERTVRVILKAMSTVMLRLLEQNVRFKVSSLVSFVFKRKSTLHASMKKLREFKKQNGWQRS